LHQAFDFFSYDSIFIVLSTAVSAFQKKPLFTLTALGTTSWMSAKKMEFVLNTHLVNRNFMYKVLMKHIDQCSRYGFTVNWAFFNNSNSTVMQTVPQIINGVRFGYTQEPVEAFDRGVSNDPIHVLNFFCNPEIGNIEKSDYLGFKDRVPLSSFAAKNLNNPYYIKKNVKKVIDMCMKGDYNSDGAINNDMNRVAATVHRGYYKLHFKGNEDDDTLYYCETVDNNLIRMHPNTNERNNTNIDVMTFDKRIESVVGNSSGEMQIPMEHMLHTVLQMEADAAVQRLQNYILFNGDLGIDTTKIREHAKNGGMIPVYPKPGMDFKNAFWQTTFNNDGYRGIENILREVKESSQRVKDKPDMFRGVNPGGINNNTATAANMMKTEGDLVANFNLGQFAYGLAGVGESNMDILKQHLAPFFTIRERKNSDPIELAKHEVLGNHGVETETGLTINNQLQAMNLLNVITAIQNFKGTQDQSWANVNVTDLVRGWIKSVAPNYDSDRIFPEMTPQGLIPQNQMVGMGQQQTNIPMEAQVA
jgi:hypothetical protein